MSFTTDQVLAVEVSLDTFEHMTLRVRALREKIAAGRITDLADVEDELRVILDEVVRVDMEAEVAKRRAAQAAKRRAVEDAEAARRKAELGR